MQENKIKQFINEMFGNVTVLQSDYDERIWFIVNEIYEKLGYSQAKDLYLKCDDEEVMSFTLTESHRNGIKDNGIRTIISFDGLMDACGSARGERKEIWKTFRKWINNTVIPNIYKDGMYVNGEENCRSKEELEEHVELATERKIIRKYGIGKRKDLTKTISVKVRNNDTPYNKYAATTNQLVYEVLFGKTAKQLKEEFGVSKLRDDLFTIQELADIATQEQVVEKLLMSGIGYSKIKEILNQY